jgi:hypothetical protein
MRTLEMRNDSILLREDQLAVAGVDGGGGAGRAKGS